MANIGDALKSGMLGLGTAAVARNPELMRGFGLIGNLAADKVKDKEDKKKMAVGMSPQPGMKKGGKVSSASKRADGCATKGKTKGRMV